MLSSLSSLKSSILDFIFQRYKLKQNEWGVWKSFGLASTTLSHRASWTTFADLRSVISHRGGKQFSFPRPWLRRRSVTGVENCLLLPQLWNHNGGCVVNLVMLVFRNWVFSTRNKLAKWSKQITGSRNTWTRDGFCAAEWDNGYE